MTRFANPHNTLTVEEDSPSPGGLANGLWNGCPVTPLTQCGIALQKRQPPKKYETKYNQPIVNAPLF